MSPLAYLQYAPIVRGFAAIMIAGSLFPLTGVFVLRLNLITLRFMLMHGTLLGAAIALAAGASPVLFGAVLNLLLVLAIAWLSRSQNVASGTLTTFFMVLTIGLAFAVVYRFDVPAKDTLAILWGNLYALAPLDLLLTAGFALASLGFVALLFGRLKAVLYSREIAFASGIDEPLLNHMILVLTGLTVAFAVRLIGALLLDAILLLPAIVSSLFARSTRQLFVGACAAGAASSAAGFLISLFLDIPASSAVTIVAALILGAGFVIRRRKR